MLLCLGVFFCTNVLANFLTLKNNNLYCDEYNCNINIKINQKLVVNEKNKVIELIEDNKSIIKYYFYTTDINSVVAYSGKPLELLVSLTKNGIIDDIKLIKHSEPILLTGIHIEKLLEAVCFYKGKNIKNKINIGEDFSGGLNVPIIAGATVTSLILHETILDSARDVGVMYNIMDKDDFSDEELSFDFVSMSWENLLKIGAVRHYLLDKNYNIRQKIGNEKLLIDMYFADLSHPSIGENLLGSVDYCNLMNELEKDQSAIIILNNGIWSFKGNGFVRGGIFDRFHIEQGTNSFSFRDSNYKLLYDLDCVDLDDFRETGIFIVNSSKYNVSKAWDLVLLLDYKSFKVNYKLPSFFYKHTVNKYFKIWQNKKIDIILFLMLWFIVIFLFSIRALLAKYNLVLFIIYNSVLLGSVYIIGIRQAGQPSIVNVFSLLENIKNLEIFLLEPYIFIGWIMIIFTVLLWGKALFCGWICPFGALQELLFMIKSVLFKHSKSKEFSLVFIHKLKYLRYVIFLSLICISFVSIMKAELIAEIEPFKTIWNIGLGGRQWYFSLYTVVLLCISVCMYRFFCRFICPLGAFLSLLSVLQIFRLKRLDGCKICKICAKACGSCAIDNYGVIDNKECFGCFSCISNMHNNKLCPPLITVNMWKKYEV